MGHEFRLVCQSEIRRLLLLMGVVFAMVLILQYFELPYGSVLSSIFPAGKVPVQGKTSPLTGDSLVKSEMVGNMTPSDGRNSTDTYAVHKIVNNTKNTGVDKKDGGQGNDTLSESNRSSDENESSEENKNLTMKNVKNSDDGSSPEKTREPEGGFSPKNVAVDNSSSLSNIQKENDTSISEKGGRLNTALTSPSPATPPIIASTNITSPTILDTNLIAPVISVEPENFAHLNTGLTSPLTAMTPIISSTDITSLTILDTSSIAPVISVEPPASPGVKDATKSFNRDEKPGPLQGEISVLDNNYSVTSVPLVKKGAKIPAAAVVTISEMNDLLLQSRASSRSMRPRWSSSVDRELVDAKSLIENAPVLKNDIRLYAPIYRNVSMFKRSYELMEQTLKVYIYREGARPVFHQPNSVLKGIYASEGWFMKLLEANRQFVTKNPRKAHLFYLPFSSRMLEETLYVPNSHSHTNLIQCLKNYLDMIVAKYPFWNRTGGADHFLVACHDWAPYETKQHMAHCIRALCNSDIKEGFKFGKDVSLPETYVRIPQNPLRDLGGKPPSQRRILAFFAGNMHGSVRPILLKFWENKDPDMRIFGRMPKVKGKMNYIQHMKSSKYCICAKGYEVNSPRVVEAIFYECVPVIISDNFVPPFFEVLNWESFAVFVLEKDIPNLKNILLSIPQKRYLQMQMRVKKVQQHFLWHSRPVKYDLFHMILHSIWYNRVLQFRPR